MGGNGDGWGVAVNGRIAHLWADRGKLSLRPGFSRPAVAVCGVRGVLPAASRARRQAPKRCAQCEALAADPPADPPFRAGQFWKITQGRASSMGRRVGGWTVHFFGQAAVGVRSLQEAKVAAAAGGASGRWVRRGGEFGAEYLDARAG